MSGGHEFDWAKKLEVFRDLSPTPEELAKAGWTVPERGDALRFSNPHCLTGEIDETTGGPDGEPGSLISKSFDVFALPDSLTISRPDFITPALLRDQIRTAALSETEITPPKLWLKTARDSNVLGVKINNQPAFEVSLDIEGKASEGEVVAILQIAVRAALQQVVNFVEDLQKKWELGITEPWPYRIAFRLADVDKKENSASEFATRAGGVRFKSGI